MPNFLEMENVAAWRGDTRVFESLSLEIPSGSSTVLLGPNGSGKSTLLRLLSREIHPEHREGSRMRLFGRERWNTWELRGRLGIVSQDLQGRYWGGATGREVVLSGYYSTSRVWPHHRFTEAQREHAAEILRRIGMSEFEDRAYARLSTGEQRRLLLGRALVHDPEVLVLDEPMSGLDPGACFGYLGIVRELIRSGATVILATHHLHEIPPEIGRAVLLGRGRVIADGPPDEVLTSARLSDLFDAPIEVVRANGFLQALPGR